MNELISVIIPVYNVETFLDRSIRSVLNQTYHNIEVILIDDGSTDNSGRICDYYCIYDKRVHCVHKKNEGQAVARNIGISIANGDWIAFLDADDWIENNMLQVLYEAGIDNKSSLIACKTQNYYLDACSDNSHDSGNISNFTISQTLNLLLNNNVIRFEIWNKLWKRELIGKTKFKAGQIGEEVYFDFEIFKKINFITFVDRTLHHYLVERDGNTNSKFRIERMCIFDEFDSYIDYLNEKKEVKDMKNVACIAAMFCISVYLEGQQRNQPKSLLRKLRHLFFHFVFICGLENKTKAILLFAFSPSLYQIILDYRFRKLKSK